MTDSDARPLRTGRHRSMPSRRDEISVDLVDDDGSRDAGRIGADGRRWAESMVDVARFELARADDKANTLFRFYGVVAALSIGLLIGQGWSPADLRPVSQVLFWGGCAALGVSGVYLGRVLYPRKGAGSTNPAQLLFHGHVLAHDSPEQLAASLREVEHDPDGRLLEQLAMLSRLVEVKFSYTRAALWLLAAGSGLCVIATVADLVVTRVG